MGKGTWGLLRSGQRCGTGSLGQYMTPDMRESIRAQRTLWRVLVNVKWLMWISFQTMGAFEEARRRKRQLVGSVVDSTLEMDHEEDQLPAAAAAAEVVGGPQSRRTSFSTLRSLKSSLSSLKSIDFSFRTPTCSGSATSVSSNASLRSSSEQV